MADFWRRFRVSLVLTVPLLAPAPVIQDLLGVREAWAFRGSDVVQSLFASVIFFHGGWPFLGGLVGDPARRGDGSSRRGDSAWR